MSTSLSSSFSILSSLLSFLLLFFSSTTPVSSYPTGPDPAACTNGQQPEHVNPVIFSSGGYSVTIASNTASSDNAHYRFNSNILFTISSPAGATFEGFMISAMNSAGQRVGVWTSETTFPTTTTTCPVGTSIAHASPDPKQSINVQFSTPTSYGTGPITFSTTIVPNLYTTYIQPSFTLQEEAEVFPPSIVNDIIYVDSFALDNVDAFAIIQWTASNPGSSSLSSYTIELSDSNTVVISTNPISPSTTITNITGLAASTTYNVRIQATNTQNANSGFSNYFAFTTAPTVVPIVLPPNNITVTTTATGVSLTFIVPNLHGLPYLDSAIEYGLSATGPYTLLDTAINRTALISNTPVTIIFNGLPSGSSYFVRLRLHTVGLQFVFSSDLVATTSSSCTNACSNQGFCSPQATCYCNVGFVGADCSIAVSMQPSCIGGACMYFQVANSGTTPYLYWRMRVNTQGWIGVMYGVNNGMANGKGYFMTVDNTNGRTNATTVLSIQSLENNVQPIFVDTPSSLQFIGFQTASYTDVQFWRPLSSSGPTDYSFSPLTGLTDGLILSAYAYGDQIAFLQHAFSSRFRINVDLSGQRVIEVAQPFYLYMYLPVIISGLLVLIGGMMLNSESYRDSKIGMTLLYRRVGTCPKEVRKGETGQYEERVRSHTGDKTDITGKLISLFNLFTLDFFPSVQDLLFSELLVLFLYLLSIALFIAIGYHIYSSIIGCRPFYYLFGHLVAFHLPLTFLPVTKNSLWVPLLGIPFERAIKYHRWLARATLIWIYTHFITQLYVQGSFIVSSTFETPYGSGMIYGFVAMVLMSGMALFALETFRRRFLELFLYLHLTIYPIVCVMAMLHNITVRYIFILPLFLLVVDKLLRMLRPLRTPRVASLGVLKEKGNEKNRVTLITLERPEGFRYEAGQWALLNVPSISVGQWHPFSLSSSPSLSLSTDDDYSPTSAAPIAEGQKKGILTFHLKDMGEGTFTHALAELASQHPAPKPLPAVHMSGPYGKLSVPIFSDPQLKTIVLVAGGIGATPMLSVLGELYAAHLKGRLNSIQSVHLIWVNKTSGPFHNWNPSLFQAITWSESARSIFTFHLFATQRSGSGLEMGAIVQVEAVGRGGEENAYESKDGGGTEDETRERVVVTSGRIVNGIKVNSGRPNLKGLFHLISDQNEGIHASKSQVATLVCGPTALVLEAQHQSLVRGWKFHKETFAW